MQAQLVGVEVVMGSGERCHPTGGRADTGACGDEDALTGSKLRCQAQMQERTVLVTLLERGGLSASLPVFLWFPSVPLLPLFPPSASSGGSL